MKAVPAGSMPKAKGAMIINAWLEGSVESTWAGAGWCWGWRFWVKEILLDKGTCPKNKGRLVI